MKNHNVATAVGAVLGTLGQLYMPVLETKAGVPPGSFSPLLGLGAAFLMRWAAKLPVQTDATTAPPAAK